MKKIIIAIILITTSCAGALACDICGSGSGNTYFGLLPGFQKKFLGIRYQYNSLRHHLGPNGENTYLTAREQFHVAEVWGAVNLGKRFRVAGFIPYSFASRRQAGQTQHTNGLGDVSVIGYYKLAGSTDDNPSGAWQHQAWLGAGLKLPTGKYNADETNIAQGAQNSFQLGSGSLDYVFNAVYDIRYKNTGLSTNLSYRLNSSNRFNYQYGDKWNANLQLYSMLGQKNKVTVKPHAGFLYESASRDLNDAHLPVWQSGGDMGLATMGLDVSFGRISVSTSYQHVLFQQLGEDRIRGGNRVMAGLNWIW